MLGRNWSRFGKLDFLLTKRVPCPSSKDQDKGQCAPCFDTTMSISMRDFIPPIAVPLLRGLKRKIIHSGSTGLNGLDLKLIRYIKPRRGGYFVELGANDGISQSNTFKLQRAFDWTGLLIEPSPIRFKECISNRSFGDAPHICCNACVPFDYSDRFVEIEDSDLMSVAKGLDVSDSDAASHADAGARFLQDTRMRMTYGAVARTLTSLLDEVSAPSDFDLLSLDVEGNELAVLKGLDFQRYRPKWILVEIRDRREVFDYLEHMGYRHIEDLSSNLSYSDCLFAP